MPIRHNRFSSARICKEKGKSKKQSQNGVDIDYPDPDEQKEGSGWKDEKPYGTYVEVTGILPLHGGKRTCGSGTYRSVLCWGKTLLPTIMQRVIPIIS